MALLFDNLLIYQNNESNQELNLVRRVLLATDFSEYANQAIYHALNLLGDEEIDYYLVNSYGKSNEVPEMLIFLEDILQKQALERLSIALSVYQQQYQSAKFKCVAVQGDASEVIGNIADDYEVDLVVLGSGKKTMDRALRGRTISRLIRRIKQPLLIVPAGLMKPYLSNT